MIEGEVVKHLTDSLRCRYSEPSSGSDVHMCPGCISNNACKVTVVEVFDRIATLVLLLDIQISKAKPELLRKVFPSKRKKKKLIRENHFFIPFDSCLINYGVGTRWLA